MYRTIIVCCLMVVWMISCKKTSVNPSTHKGSTTHFSGNSTSSFVSGKVFAVLIGINQYKVYPDGRKNWRHLRFTVRDVKGIRRVLTGPGKVPRQHIKVLYNKRASKGNIIRTLKKWLKRAGPKDTVLVYFSGHGAAGSDGISYWMAYDTPKNAVESGISQYMVNGLLSALRTERVVLMIDACQSGQGLQGTSGGNRGGIDPSVYKSKGRAILSSSMQSEYSYESGRLKHGVFSYVLMEALGGKADTNRDGIVDVLEVYQYINAQVPRLAKRLEGGQQHPVFEYKAAGVMPLSFPGVSSASVRSKKADAMRARELRWRKVQRRSLYVSCPAREVAIKEGRRPGKPSGIVLWRDPKSWNPGSVRRTGRYVGRSNPGRCIKCAMLNWLYRVKKPFVPIGMSEPLIKRRKVRAALFLEERSDKKRYRFYLLDKNKQVQFVVNTFMKSDGMQPLSTFCLVDFGHRGRGWLSRDWLRSNE